ncbi:hypothetical protein [Thiothrix lacustris]|jgi:hypothetical protein|uniref:Uncharacterized protein n=1 Tax=Thiothrix lacustris TaxID=525917 RepID=A0ABY9MTK2_9GAMM|nr:hypothetical protein [Thiothrix lacustris]WML91989.1 hypothetical protein RCF98_06515 [Thiothrix lacustris]WMP16190.1 hypothetical protein RCS87_12410 [Thiothrix lacustris]
MISATYGIVRSSLNNWVDSLAFIMIALFYVLSVLQLPVSEIIQMFAILAAFSIGINTVLSSHAHIDHATLNQKP